MELGEDTSIETVTLIENTAEAIRDSADCAIGTEAAEMILRGLKSFGDDYEEHALRKRCTEEIRNDKAPVPCVSKCPAEVDIPGYIALVLHGRYDDAIKVIRKDNPFPHVCGLICEHPCEDRCRRNLIDAPINIRAMKRYAVDNCSDVVPIPDKLDDTGKRIAIIGGGPSGLTAAYYLALMGHKPKIFEKRQQLGGMLRYGIPNYRLPRENLQWDIDSILSSGVEVELNYDVNDEEKIKNLRDEFDAVYISIGAHTFKQLGIEGENARGVIPAVAMLRDIGDEHKPDFKDKAVVVVGGGNVAMDVARTAKRLGASSVTIVYRRRRADMTALDEEIEGAVAEGCELDELKAPVRVETDDKGFVKALWVKPQMAGEYKAGRPKPINAKADEQSIPCDIIISAIGQNIEYEMFEKYGVPVVWGSLKTESSSAVEDREGVYAGGDCVTGPSTVIKAIAAGKVAAANIDNYLGYDHEIKTDVEIPYAENVDKKPCGRAEIRLRYATRRGEDFDGIECNISDEEALQEAGRCLRCDHFGLGSFRGGRLEKW